MAKRIVYWDPNKSQAEGWRQFQDLAEALGKSIESYTSPHMASLTANIAQDSAVIISADHGYENQKKYATQLKKQGYLVCLDLDVGEGDIIKRITELNNVHNFMIRPKAGTEKNRQRDKRLLEQMFG